MGKRKVETLSDHGKRDIPSAALLSHNGVRMIRDHERYAEFCRAADAIYDLKEYLNGSCVDLIWSVQEADWFCWLNDQVTKVREEVDNWRASKGMNNPPSRG